MTTIPEDHQHFMVIETRETASLMAQLTAIAKRTGNGAGMIVERPNREVVARHPSRWVLTALLHALGDAEYTRVIIQKEG